MVEFKTSKQGEFKRITKFMIIGAVVVTIVLIVVAIIIFVSKGKKEEVIEVIEEPEPEVEVEEIIDYTTYFTESGNTCYREGTERIT